MPVNDIIDKNLTFLAYQRIANSLNITLDSIKKMKVSPLMFFALALTEEAGEFAGKVKKIVRNKEINPDKLPESEKTALLYELGDVLWYISQLARILDSDINEVARLNLQKLLDRKKRKVIKSSGDNR